MDTLLQVAASWILPALFFWFLFSIFAMIIIEFLQRIMKSRQKGLEEVIQDLLGDKYVKEFYKHALINPLEDDEKEEQDNQKRGKKKDIRPSYISPTLFAKVIMDWMLKNTKIEKQEKKETIEISAPWFYKVVMDWILNKIQPPKSDEKGTFLEIIQNNVHAIGQENKQLGQVLQAIVNQANVKTNKDSEFLELIQKDLEAWFLEAVGQMHSVYGARLQGKTILVSAIVAAVANFDLVNITVRLWETSKYSELKALGQNPTFDPILFTRLPVGWYSDYLPSTSTEWVIKIAGICLGAFFIAIGSQYVFNLTRTQYKPATEKDSE